MAARLTNIARRGSMQSSGTRHLGTSKQTLAAQLNLAHKTLSRMLGQLSQAGLIEMHGRTIRVLDVARLRAFSA